MNEGIEKITICGLDAWLLPEKAVYFPTWKLLAVADVHIGKAAHFRKHGMAVSRGVFEKDLFNLGLLLKKYTINKVVFIGDLFHSNANRECDDFLTWRENFKAVDFVLVKGNHDILPEVRLARAQVQIADETLRIGGIIFRHEPPEEVADEGCYFLCGHLHPAIRLSGRALQSVIAPCFLFAERTGILPAFGTLTGRHVVSPRAGEKVYAVTPGKVWALPGR